MKENALSNLYQYVHADKGYYGSAWRFEGRSFLISKILGILAPGTRVLDLGCRDGFLTAPFLDGCKVVGIDIDSKSLELYESRIKNASSVRTIISDLNQKFPLDDHSFDIVIAGEVIEHLIHPPLFISEIKRVLDKDGKFVGTTPNAARFDKRLQLFRGKDPKEFSDPTHLQYFTRSSLKHILFKFFNSVEIIPYRKDRPCQSFSELRADGFVFVCNI